MRLLSSFLLLISMHIVQLAHGQAADTIRPGKGHLMTSYLKPGLQQYFIYMQDPHKNRELTFWYWLRDISLETHNGAKVFAIKQRWYGSDSSWFRTVYSLNAQDDFAPIYFAETSGGARSADYNWNADGISGADTVEGNVKKAFHLKFDAPNMNWNLDIETFEMLPLAEGKSFLINFYDAGLDPPAYVLYKVIGSEELSLFGGEKTDCWKLTTEGKDSKGEPYSEIYWISKKGHEFLKEEDIYGTSMYRVKVKMPAGMPDLTKKFTSQG
jgi:hypothetical protein